MSGLAVIRNYFKGWRRYLSISVSYQSASLFRLRIFSHHPLQECRKFQFYFRGKGKRRRYLDGLPVQHYNLIRVLYRTQAVRHHDHRFITVEGFEVLHDGALIVRIQRVGRLVHEDERLNPPPLVWNKQKYASTRCFVCLDAVNIGFFIESLPLL